MLHHTKKKAAIKKYANHESDAVADVRDAIKNEYPEITEDELDELMTSMKQPVEETAPLTVDKIQLNGEKKSLNGSIADKLKDFNYENLTGEKFRDYCLLVQTLQLSDSYDFEQYKVEVVKKPRYRGVKDSPVDVIGFKMVNTKPINTTRIPVKVALIFNGTVRQEEGENFFETIGSQLEHNGKEGRYYLLKKA